MQKFWLAALLSTVQCVVALGGQAAAYKTTHLVSDPFPVPLEIPGDPQRRKITRIALDVRLPLAGGASRITLHETAYQFNAFGDGTPAGEIRAQPQDISLRPHKEDDRSILGGSGWKRPIYELVFPKRELSGQLFLVVGSDAGGTHRLIVRGKPSTPDGAPLLTVAELRNPDLSAESQGFGLGEVFYLDTIAFLTPQKPRPQRITVRRRGKTGTLDLDPNHLGFDAYGDINLSTLIGSIPPEVEWRRLNVKDSTEQGRQIFRLEVLGDPLKQTYEAVLSPLRRGPHRLLIREDGQLREILWLRDPQSAFHMRIQEQLATTSVEEQVGVAMLHREIGDAFTYRVDQGAITQIRIDAPTTSNVIDPALARLTRVQSAEFSGLRMTAAGLPSLQKMPKLGFLRLAYCQLDDAGMESLKDLREVRTLFLSYSNGLTDAGFAHLAGLKALERLDLEHVSPRPAERLSVEADQRMRVTDAGLAALKDLKCLKVLNLSGLELSDAGLTSLSGLTELENLSLSGKDITNEGLRQLEGLTSLESLFLRTSSVTAAGAAALKTKLPRLSISLNGQ